MIFGTQNCPNTILNVVDLLTFFAARDDVIEAEDCGGAEQAEAEGDEEHDPAEGGAAIFDTILLQFGTIFASILFQFSLEF